MRAIGSTHRETLSGHAAHARLRHVRQRGTMARMGKSKRVALSLTVSDSAAQCLKERAAREGHRYHLAFAASLLERAVEAPAGGLDWPSDLRTFARFHGAKVAIDGDRVTMIMGAGTTDATCARFKETIQGHYPPPAGVVFEVRT